MVVITLFLREYIKRIKSEAGKHYISLSIVSTTDGSVLMYDAKDSSIDNKGSGSYQFGIMKSVAMGLQKMEKEEDRKQDIFEITVTYEGQKHILALSETRKFMVHLIIDESANIALIKKFMEITTINLVKQYTNKVGSESIKKVDITSLIL